MSRPPNARRLSMPAFAQEGQPLAQTTLLQEMSRLVLEAQDLPADAAVQWQARAELRPRTGGDDEVWLHLAAQARVPLTCQRCMGAVETDLQVDQWYRFVESEAIAMAEDDESEEDLLVMEPQFDLLSLIEDELLMGLPLVPMHDACPSAPQLQVGPTDDGEAPVEKPNPFAVLAQLKKSK